jgi:hypothetical protein
MYEFCIAVPVSAIRIGPVRGIGVVDCPDADWELELPGRGSEAGVSSVT